MIERVPRYVWPVLLGLAILILGPIWLLDDDQELAIPKRTEPVLTEITLRDVPSLEPVIAAPLFNPARSPVVELPDEASPAEAEAEPPPPAPLPQLVGVISARRGKAAAIVRTANGEEVTLKRGETVEGWLLKSVGKGDAVFAMSDRVETVRLDFGNRAMGGGAGPEPDTEARGNEQRD
ncbi:MAG: hypothetical protein R3E02_04180 [Blastomonas sp.]